MKKILSISLILIFAALVNSSVQASKYNGTMMEISQSGDIQLGQNYPNPAKGQTYIKVNLTSETAVLSVYDLLGKLVEKRTISSNTIITLDVSKYTNGIYHYTLESNGEKITKRMTVRNN